MRVEDNGMMPWRIDVVEPIMCQRRVVFALVAGLIVSAACRGGPTAPQVGLGEEFVLAPGEHAYVDTPSVSILFVEVTGDSRCPADAQCIQGGDAVVRLEVARSEARATAYELHTGDMRPVTHEDVTIALVQLAPYPFSSRTIEQGEYRATLRATGAPAGHSINPSGFEEFSTGALIDANARDVVDLHDDAMAHIRIGFEAHPGLARIFDGRQKILRGKSRPSPGRAPWRRYAPGRERETARTDNRRQGPRVGSAAILQASAQDRQSSTEWSARTP